MGQLPKNIKVSLQEQTALLGNTALVYLCRPGSCDEGCTFINLEKR